MGSGVLHFTVTRGFTEVQYNLDPVYTFVLGTNPKTSPFIVVHTEPTVRQPDIKTQNTIVLSHYRHHDH